MNPAEILKELDMVEALADTLKDKAARLRLILTRISGSAPKGGYKKSHLTDDQRAYIIAKRRAFRNKKSAGKN